MPITMVSADQWVYMYKTSDGKREIVDAVVYGMAARIRELEGEIVTMRQRQAPSPVPLAQSPSFRRP